MLLHGPLGIAAGGSSPPASRRSASVGMGRAMRRVRRSRLQEGGTDEHVAHDR